jgi:hypothetical protein
MRGLWGDVRYAARLLKRERITVGRATPSLFQVLRATPLRGRIFNDGEAPMAGVGAPPRTRR